MSDLRMRQLRTLSGFHRARAQIHKPRNSCPAVAEARNGAARPPSPVLGEDIPTKCRRLKRAPVRLSSPTPSFETGAPLEALPLESARSTATRSLHLAPIASADLGPGSGLLNQGPKSALAIGARCKDR